MTATGTHPPVISPARRVSPIVIEEAGAGEEAGGNILWKGVRWCELYEPCTTWKPRYKVFRVLPQFYTVVLLMRTRGQTNWETGLSGRVAAYLIQGSSRVMTLSAGGFELGDLQKLMRRVGAGGCRNITGRVDSRPNNFCLTREHGLLYWFQERGRSVHGSHRGLLASVLVADTRYAHTTEQPYLVKKVGMRVFSQIVALNVTPTAKLRIKPGHCTPTSSPWVHHITSWLGHLESSRRSL